eukprot:1158975-Pelagomonas_calceolata.AAC.12
MGYGCYPRESVCVCMYTHTQYTPSRSSERSLAWVVAAAIGSILLPAPARVLLRPPNTLKALCQQQQQPSCPHCPRRSSPKHSRCEH